MSQKCVMGVFYNKIMDVLPKTLIVVSGLLVLAGGMEWLLNQVA